MATEERYNGWTNRETWAVALYINNDQGWQESVLDALREDMTTDSDGFWDNVQRNEVAAARAGDITRENVEDYLYEWEQSGNLSQWRDVVTDIGSLWRVNWTELGASFLEDLEG